MEALLEGTKRAPAHIGDVLVLGLGKSGKSVARYCAALVGMRVDSLFIAAGARNDDSAAFVEELAGPGVEYAFGDDAIAPLIEAGRTFDVCIASPGIPFWADLYVQGQQVSAELVSEVEFSWRESAADSVWVAITGTNGKTTTTSCCAHVLQACGLAANAVGNIGDVCLDAVQAGKTDVYVAEVSSYQLASTHAFAPDVAVLLNITPDHIHWHRTLDAYAQAKFKVLDNLGCAGVGDGDSVDEPAKAAASHAGGKLARRVAILDATNDVVRAKVRELKAVGDRARGFDYIPMGTAEGIQGDMRAKCGAENAAFLDDAGVMHVAYAGADHILAPSGELLIKGEHNASNALAAAAVAVALGAEDARIAEALTTFAPLEHRIEPCGTVDGVSCYNDSKATNVDATLKALEAFPGKRLVVLLGGDDKGTDLAELVEAVHRCASVAVCYGEAGPRFLAAFEANAADAPDGFAVIAAHHMEDALDAALDNACAGDVLLLSPACASFDEFTSFEHRGDVFKQLVAARSATQGV